MFQSQIAEYAKSQLKLGISRDAIKNALLAAGWQEADIEDSLSSAGGSVKKEEPAAKLQPEPRAAFEPAKEFLPKVNSIEKPGSFSGAKAKIVVSDLTSGPKPDVSLKADIKKNEPEVRETKNVGKERKPEEAKPMKLGELGAPERPRFWKSLILPAVLSAAVLGFAATATYLYFQNLDLSGRISSIDDGAGAGSANLAEIEGRITALQADVDYFDLENRELWFELAFFVVLPGVSPEEISVFTDIGGILHGGTGASHSFTTTHGVELTIGNSGDNGVDEILRPLVGDSILISGTHAPASRIVTVTAVNGTPIEELVEP